jgi:hypothetical protein
LPWVQQTCQELQVGTIALVLPSSHKLCNNLVQMAETTHLSDHEQIRDL